MLQNSDVLEIKVTDSHLNLLRYRTGRGLAQQEGLYSPMHKF